MTNHYGSVSQTNLADDIDGYLEELSILGYTIVENVLDETNLNDTRQLIDKIYEQQVKHIGKSNLEKISDTNMCRFCLKYDELFVKIASNANILTIVERILGKFYLLNLQNAIINTPFENHHQSNWHRDIPHQNFVISNPISINALYAIDDFSEETGGTVILPFSHKLNTLPSDSFIKKHEVQPNIKSGSVILFDSMIFHRSGNNSSGSKRRALNHIYTIPIIKQQYDISLSYSKYEKKFPELKWLFGATSQTPIDDNEWRTNRMEGMKK